MAVSPEELKPFDPGTPVVENPVRFYTILAALVTLGCGALACGVWKFFGGG